MPVAVLRRRGWRRTVPQALRLFAHQDGRVEQHPDRDEEEDSEGVAERQRLLGRPVAELGFGLQTRAVAE
jgi:hypothetical protein